MEGGKSILYTVLMSGELIPAFPTPLVQHNIRKFKLPWRELLKNIRSVSDFAYLFILPITVPVSISVRTTYLSIIPPNLEAKLTIDFAAFA